MSNDDSKSSPKESNFPNAPPVAETFNKTIELEAHIATLSPAGQQECRSIQKLSEERLESEIDGQKRSHNYRVMKEHVKRLEDYIREPALRPPGVADRANDLNIIREQSEKTVRDREAHFQERIKTEAVANVKLVVARERKGQQPERDGQGHEQER